MTTRARWLPKAQFTATTVQIRGAWKEISRSLYKSNISSVGAVTVTYDKTITFTRNAAAGVENRLGYNNTPTFVRSSFLGIENRTAYNNTIAFTRSSLLGVVLDARYERAISFSRNYLTAVELRTFYARAYEWTERTITAILKIIFWTTPRLRKKKQSNYKNFFRGRK